jgi:hypothetical protein
MKDMPFNVSQLQETKNDRYNCCHVVTALQRYQLKAVVSPFSDLILYAAIFIYHRLSLQVPELVCFECIMI